MATQTYCIACGRKFVTPIISNTGRLCRDCANQGLFRKQIIITGITRMNRGHVCVSGVDPKTWKFVRPIFRFGLDRDFTMDGATQVVRHFNLVEVEFKEYKPSHVYHTEDWLVNESFAPRYVRHLSDSEIVNILNKMSVTNLETALEPKDRSLFIVKAQKIIHLWHDDRWEKFKVIMTFIDHAGNLFEKVPVTDLLTLAFVRYQLQQRNFNYGKEIIKVFNNNPYRYVRIGLTREWKGKHWKQVTALITVPDLYDGRSFSYFENKIGDQA